MTDLLSRPAEKTTTPTPEAGPRPLGLGAAMAGAAASLGTLLTCMAVCVVGWFLADAGAHGQTTDALRVGADVWLVGHGSGITIGGTPFHVVPLALTAFFAYVAWRTGRWAAATSAPPEDDRATLLAGVVLSGVYVVVTVLTCILAADGLASAGLGRAILGTLLVSGVGVLGLASGTGRLATWVDRVPGWVRATTRGAVAGFASLLAASAVLVAARLVLGFNEAATVLSSLHLRPGDYAMFAIATLTVLPNAVLLGGSYLLGPGFAVGTGTVVSPSLVALGPVPAFPLLSALPSSGATPAWLVGLVAVPVLAAAYGAGRAQRAYGVTAWDSAALRGFGSGLGAALLSTLAIALSGGALGSGRMADFGAPFGQVLVAAIVAMSLGGLVGGLLTTLVQRRRGAGAAIVEPEKEPEAELEAEDETPEAPAAEADQAPEATHDDVEDTIEVPLLPKDPNV
ncbi:MAG: hypothetical protein JOZ82_11780 [Marmoricola sp.]|nr:hypothetical protein [Marmoricola sp.]